MTTTNCDKATYSVNVPEMKVNSPYGGFDMILHRQSLVKHDTKIFNRRRWLYDTVTDVYGNVVDVRVSACIVTRDGNEKFSFFMIEFELVPGHPITDFIYTCFKLGNSSFSVSLCLRIE